MYKGWIIASPEDQKHLEQLGIVVGVYNELEGCFDDCEVRDESMEELDSHWGQFYWALDLVEEY